MLPTIKLYTFGKMSKHTCFAFYPHFLCAMILYAQGGGGIFKFSLERKHKAVIYIVLLIVIVLVLLLVLKSCGKPATPPSGDTSQTTSTTKPLDFIPAVDAPSDSITIPAVTGINLKSGQLQQKVEFYNPKENQCYFVISIYLSDDTLIYESNYLAPAETITEINLLQTLKKGTYKNCRIVYNCYTLDSKAALNSGDVKIEINSY